MPDAANKKSKILTEKDIMDFGVLVDDFDDAIIGINLEGVIKSYNKGAEVLYGYNKEEIIGKPVSILIPEESKNEFYDKLYKVNNGCHIKHWETVRKNKDGELFLVSVSLSNLYNNKGKIIGTVCIGRNLEERQKLIDSIKESEEKWRSAIDGGNFGIWDWNIPNNTIYYSDRLKEMLGYKNNEISDTFEEWTKRIHKEDYNYVMDEVNRHIKGGEYAVEYRLRCKDSIYKWVRIRGRVLKWDNEGKPLRMTGTCEDINEQMLLRKKTEENENRLTYIYNTLNAGIALGEIILDSFGNPIDYKWLHMNNYMKKFVLEVKPEGVSKESTVKLFTDNGENWLYMFGEASQNGKSFTFENYYKTIDKYCNINIYSPNPMQFALLVTDITENKKREVNLREKYEELQAVYEELAATEEELRDNYKELERANTELERANKVKRQFLANMSHELRTPLNGILGCTQLLKLSKLSEEQNDEVLMIEESSKHLLNLINEILDLSKIESGKAVLKYNKFNFMEQIDYVIKDLVLLSKDKDIEILYYVDPFINKELIGDSLRLKQVLNNLISNAVKFTEHGHIFFKVKQISKTIDETKLQFIVEDTGKGIEEKFKKDIYGKFNQEEFSYTKNYGGVGLGLAISKELVKMMDGDVGFESEVGKGSTFYFTAVFKNVTDEEYITDNKSKPDIEAKNKNDKNILVVEDNEINMKIATAFLKQIGYTYACAHNGQEAIDYLEKNEADIILMDVQMPLLNGCDATKIIRDKETKTGEHHIIIGMTAYAMDSDKKKFIDCGMDDYISKPFDIETLGGVLDKFMK